MGSWWPPPSGGHPDSQYLQSHSGQQGWGHISGQARLCWELGEVGVVGAGSCCMILILFPAPFPGGNSEFSAPSLIFLGPVSQAFTLVSMIFPLGTHSGLPPVFQF